MKLFCVDAHCDVLMKLWRDDKLDFLKAEELQVNERGLRKAGMLLQSFAVYVPASVHPSQRFHAAIGMIDLFYEKVCAPPKGLYPVLTQKDINLIQGEQRIGALLTLEGSEALQGRLEHLRILHRLGIRAMGLTWNYRNEVADGVLEPKPGGLSVFGREVVAEMNRLRMIIDVAHLAEPGFWDVLERSSQPVMASHANVYEVRSHPRNLHHNQIKALLNAGGMIGLTFVPDFLSLRGETGMADLLRHLETVCTLGGVHQVGFGSDFDGMERCSSDLARVEDFTVLVEELLKHYCEEWVKGFVGENWLSFYRQFLS